MLQAQKPELRAIQEKYANPFHQITEDIAMIEGITIACYVSRSVGEMSEIEKNYLTYNEMYLLEVHNMPPNSELSRYARAVLAWNSGKGRKDFMMGDMTGSRLADFARREKYENKVKILEQETANNPHLPSPWSMMSSFLSAQIKQVQKKPDLQQRFEVARILAHEVGQRAGWLSPLMAKGHGVYGG